MDNASIQQKAESIQYNAALAITGPTRETSKEKPFEELGLWYTGGGTEN